jgi:hypothetical protein
MKPLLISLCLGLCLPFSPSVLAQNPPATTYQPGFWQPAARVELNRPITINLINKTGLAVNYAVTNIDPNPVLMKAEETVTLENVEPDLYIVLYPDSSNPDSSTISLKYEVKVTADNVVNIMIKQAGEGMVGDRSINLQRTGAIYIY